jgi:F1F0 ATPase subunit 2
MDASPGIEAVMTGGLAVQIAIGLIAGFLIGVLHFGSLSWNARLFTSGSAGKAIAVQMGRIAVAVAVLTLLARLGFAALLCGGLAFLVSRPFMVWRFRALR